MRDSTNHSKTAPGLPLLNDSQAKILDRVAAELAAGNPQRAFELLKAKECSNLAQFKNARGVCFMRMGDLDDALRVFRDLCLSAGGLLMRDDAPTIFKTNMATVLLLKGNVTGGLSALSEANDEASPSVIRLREAISAWKKTLSPWRRFMLRLGVEPNASIQIPFPPGDLI